MEVDISNFVLLVVTTILIFLSTYLIRKRSRTISHVEQARSSLTFRVLNIPSSISPDQFDASLQRTASRLGTAATNKGAEIQGWSYARSGHSGGLMIATVTIEPAPAPGQLETILGQELEISNIRLRADLEFLGMTPLFDPKNATIDIIAVTGLAGHAFGSWKSRRNSYMWLRDALPIALPTARVLTYGYDTRLPGSQSTSSILDLGRRLLESIKTVRLDDGKYRPLLLVGHSLGGLIIKQALSLAVDGSADDRHIFRCCSGLMFFGVPNKGLSTERLMAMVKGQPNESLLQCCKPESPFLYSLHQNFYEKFHSDSSVISIAETKHTRTVEWSTRTKSWQRSGPTIWMVPPSSALHASQGEKLHDQLFINADHSDIVKFDDVSDHDSIIIQARLKELVLRGPPLVDQRLSFHREKMSNVIHQFIKALNAPNYASFMDNQVEDPANGTLQWTTVDPVINTWQNESCSSMLWVQGTPGQGKTVFSKFLITVLQMKGRKAIPESRVVYFFFYERDDRLRGSGALLRSLVKQLLSFTRSEADLIDLITDRYALESDESLWNLFLAILSMSRLKKLYCVIDAIDECDDESRKSVLQRFKRLECLSNQRRATEARFPNIKLLLTSRPMVDISRELQQITSLELKARGEDLEQAVIQKVKDLDLLGNDLKETAKDLLLRGAGRTFLWVAIVMKRLEKMRLPTKAKIEDLIMDSPVDLDAMYERIMTRILQDSDSEAEQKLLMWVVYAQRPMLLMELEEALAVQVSSKNQQSIERYRARLSKADILRSAAGVMLEITDDDRVHLLHQSAKTYLLKTDLLNQATFTGNLHPHSLLGQTCMVYLNFTEFQVEPSRSVEERARRKEQYLLLQYAARNWHVHAKEGGEIDKLSSYIRAIIQPQSPTFRSWTEAAGRSQLGSVSTLWGIATDLNAGWLMSIAEEDAIVVSEEEVVEAAQTVNGYNTLEGLLADDKTVFTTQAYLAVARLFDENMIGAMMSRTDYTFNLSLLRAALENEKYSIPLVIGLRWEPRHGSGCRRTMRWKVGGSHATSPFAPCHLAPKLGKSSISAPPAKEKV